jgi:hypothetical protein
MPASDAKQKSLSPLELARVMWIAFLCAASGIIAIAHLVRAPESHTSPNPAFSCAIAGVAIISLLYLAFFRRKLLARSRALSERTESDRALATWRVAQVLGFAAAMSIVLYGFLLHAMQAQPAWISTALFVGGIVVFVAFFPQRPESR